MGLDISYYEHMTPLRDDEVTVKEVNNCDVYRWHAHAQFWDRLDGIDAPYVRPHGKIDGFRAGAYSAYNRWREKLAVVATGLTPEEIWRNEGPLKEQPFWGLINFSDCEGCIGPQSSARLAREFKHYRQLFLDADYSDFVFYSTTPDEAREAFMRLYDDFAKAFEIAADTGYVRFH